MLYQLVNLLIPLITLPYLTRVLNANNMGIYTYNFTIISYFLIFATLGSNIYGSRKIAYVRNDHTNLSRNFIEIQLFRTLTVLITIIVLFLSINIFESKILILYQSINIFALIFDISWFYQGIEDFKKISLRNIIIKMILLILLFILVKEPEDLKKYALLVALLNLFSNFIFWIGINKKISFKYQKLNIKKHFKESIHLFIPQITISIYTLSDKLMIGYLIDKKYVSFYNVSNKLIVMSMILITTVGAVLLPRISNMYSNKKYEEMKNMIKTSFDYLTLLAVGLIFGIIATAKDIVNLLFTGEYLNIYILIQVMSITIIFWTWNNITGSQILIPTKNEKKITISVLIGAIINIALNFVLIKKYNAMGAVLATVLTEGVVTFIQIYYSKEYFKFNIKLMLKSLVSGIIMLIILSFLDNFILKIIMGILIYLFSLIMLKEKIILDIIGKRRLKYENN
ncbi:flippase [Psychrilyobacter sp. BL5]|nr:flippase [Psychrilyobacter piezotolerans]